MKTLWQCRFCGQEFPVKTDASEHTVEAHNAPRDPPRKDQYLWEVWR